MSYCVEDRDGNWHLRRSKGDSWFVPIRCGGRDMGIILPGNAVEREPTCPECIEASAPVQPNARATSGESGPVGPHKPEDVTGV